VSVAVLISIIATLVTAVTGRPISASAQSPPPTVLYRVDTRPPDEVFTEGFQPLGTESNLIAHVIGQSIADRTSSFIALTDDLAYAQRLAVQTVNGVGRPDAYIYTIEPRQSMFSVNVSLRDSDDALQASGLGDTDAHRILLNSVLSVMQHQHEWVSDEAIPSTAIRSAIGYGYDAPTSTGGLRYQVIDRVENGGYESTDEGVQNVGLLIPVADLVAPLGLEMDMVDVGDSAADYPLAMCTQGGSNPNRDLKATSRCPVRRYDFTHLGEAFDSVRDKTVTIMTAFEWIRFNSGPHYVTGPKSCLGPTFSGYHNVTELHLNCPVESWQLSSYYVRLGAGGSRNTYIDHRFGPFTGGQLHSISSLAIPNLQEPGETIGQGGWPLGAIFKYDNSWWSNLTVEAAIDG
jgi:hypothetical protein